MDDTVMAALTRWPDVPDVYGWMSLSEQGQWRLHPNADAWQTDLPCTPPFVQGESIESPQICRFIDRNYAGDNRGRWYFQNGPQRVYVRLDAAPYILRTDSVALTLRTHNGLSVTQVESWWLDGKGRLYALTEHGAGLVSGRDAPAVFDAMHTSNGMPLLHELEHLNPAFFESDNTHAAIGALRDRPPIRVRLQTEVRHTCIVEAPLYLSDESDLAAQLGFIHCPQP